jgi:hypothetical protein
MDPATWWAAEEVAVATGWASMNRKDSCSGGGAGDLMRHIAKLFAGIDERDGRRRIVGAGATELRRLRLIGDDDVLDRAG